MNDYEIELMKKELKAQKSAIEALKRLIETQENLIEILKKENQRLNGR